MIYDSFVGARLVSEFDSLNEIFAIDLIDSAFEGNVFVLTSEFDSLNLI